MVHSKRKEDFSKFMSSVLRNSMLTGIPQIVGAKSSRQRLVRAVVFVLCVIGFVYQSVSFMDLYYEYKTVIDIMVHNPEEVEFPGISFCTPNPIKVDKYCAENSTFRDNCGDVTVEGNNMDWCKCLPRYCNAKGEYITRWFPRAHHVVASNAWSYDMFKNYSQTFEELLDECRSVDYDYQCNYTNKQRFRVTGDDRTYMANCFSFGTLRGMPDGKPDILSSRKQFSLFFLPDSANYAFQIAWVNLQIQFHDPRGFVNPYESGHSVKPGFETKIWFKKLVKHLLPPPYETNCRDYDTEWRARGGHGPIDERACIDECRKNASMQIRGCMEEQLLHPIDWGSTVCHDFEENHLNVSEYVSKISAACEKDCKPACYQMTYVVRREERSRKGFYCGRNSMLDDLIWVELILDGMETTVYTYSPKIQIIETFSYLGGYVGMWLGISLVAVFDFFETLVEVCKYPFRRMALMREKKARVHRMKSSQWTY